MSFFKKKPKVEEQEEPRAIPVEAEEVEEEPTKKYTKEIEEEDLEDLPEVKKGLNQVEETEEPSEQDFINAIVEDRERLVNHENRLQTIEAALFRLKGSI